MNWNKGIRKLADAAFLPLCILAFNGIVMGLGYCLCPQSMQGGSVYTLSGKLGWILTRAAGALSDNAGLLFAASISHAYSNSDDSFGFLYGLIVWQILTALSSANFLSVLTVLSELEESALWSLQSPAAGVLAGLFGSLVHRYIKKKGASWLASTAFMSLLAIPVSFGALFIWVHLYEWMVFLGERIVWNGPASVAVFATLNRLLMPVNLHQGLNQMVLFRDGAGDLPMFWGNAVGDTVGQYMSAFFAPMSFGMAGLAQAGCLSFREDRRKTLFLGCAAIGTMLCGFSEPLELWILLEAPALFLVSCMLFGISGIITWYSGFRAGFALSGGLADLYFSAAFPAARNTILFIPLALAAFFAYFFIARMFFSKKTKEKITAGNPDSL